ncbi:hypothetical protein HM1_0968 [Heliomicrobium modesticaldum Ice1]|uniref:Uncharacterized protein n=1 Tax=Heliobacterium modesticaldum (strain ATCC 51547 / Ice1) TaxID=498761 RepID=B0TA61_HELMI|nr:hypothetical protein [Heliomicrobium modesticaldum]ABZ83598.1 hypothetical protein HM1_0968 [Heliomicrobium modesticaldum Ice1]
MAGRGSFNWFDKLERWKDVLEDDKGQIILLVGLVILSALFSSIFKDD